MDGLTRAGYLAHSESRQFKRRLGDAAEEINRAKDFAISVSWGKDSVALLALVARRYPDIAVISARYRQDAERLADADVIRDAILARPEMQRLRYAEIDVPGEWEAFERTGHAFTSVTNEAEREALDWWGREFQERTRSAIEAAGAQGVMLGMRADESRARRIVVATMGAHYERRDGLSVSLPIARWSGRDVWALTVRLGLPWLRIYDFAKDRDRARSDFTWAAGGSGVTRYGAVSDWRAAYPDQISQWFSRWPELRSASHV